MKKMIFFFLLVISSGFADQLELDNQTSYPSKGAKMAVQWAYSAKGVDEGNYALLYGQSLKNTQIVKQSGKVHLPIPQNAEYFRIILWSNGKGKPDFHTNWVEVVDRKVYLLQEDHLVPSVLLSGTGC